MLLKAGKARPGCAAELEVARPGTSRLLSFLCQEGKLQVEINMMQLTAILILTSSSTTLGLMHLHPPWQQNKIPDAVERRGISNIQPNTQRPTTKYGPLSYLILRNASLSNSSSGLYLGKAQRSPKASAELRQEEKRWRLC